jgi:hypothetical protein
LSNSDGISSVKSLKVYPLVFEYSAGSILERYIDLTGPGTTPSLRADMRRSIAEALTSVGADRWIRWTHHRLRGAAVRRSRARCPIYTCTCWWRIMGIPTGS